MDIMTHAKFYFNRLMLTLIFAIRASEPPPPRPGERLKRPGLIGLRFYVSFSLSGDTIQLFDSFRILKEKEELLPAWFYHVQF